jgi:ribonuclease P protein subunit POP4
MITPRNVAHHELVGLCARVVDSADTTLVGVGGRVVEETANTLTLATDDGEKTVPKEYTAFEFDLPDATVRVDGEAICARPAERARGV